MSRTSAARGSSTPRGSSKVGGVEAPSSLSLRLVVETSQGVLWEKQGFLKKPGTLSSTKVYVVLDAQTLTWHASEADASKVEVDARHRLPLARLAVHPLQSGSGCDLDLTSTGADGKKTSSLVLRAKDKGEAREWVEYIDAAIAVAVRALRDDSSLWLDDLNSCVANGCTMRKFSSASCGCCRMHFRLFYGEEPAVDASDASADPEEPMQLVLHTLVLPRHAGKLGLELCGDADSFVAAVAKDGLASVAGVRVGDRCVGASGYAVTGAAQLAWLLPQLPPSSAVHLTVVRVFVPNGRALSDAETRAVHADTDQFIALEDFGGRPLAKSWMSGREADDSAQAGATVGDDFSRLFEAATPPVTASVYGGGGGGNRKAAAAVAADDVDVRVRPGPVRCLGSVRAVLLEALSLLADPDLSATVRRGYAAATAAAGAGAGAGVGSNADGTDGADGADGQSLELGTLLARLPEWGVPEESAVGAFFKVSCLGSMDRDGAERDPINRPHQPQSAPISRASYSPPLWH